MSRASLRGPVSERPSCAFEERAAGLAIVALDLRSPDSRAGFVTSVASYPNVAPGGAGARRQIHSR